MIEAKADAATETPALAEPAAPGRLASIDILRGLAMIVMALDHTRDYFGPTPFDPIDPAETTPAWFAARWVTHFCAPVFVLLAGTSAFMVGRRMTRDALARRLWKRGLWLIFVELTIVGAGWGFLFLGLFMLQVIWAIGWSMIALSLLIRLPLPVIGAFGLAMIGWHNLLDLYPPGGDFASTDLWAVLHVQRPLPSLGEAWLIEMPRVWVIYPLIPWIGVMAFGYRFGSMLVRPDRDRVCVLTGLAMILGFVLIRAFGAYGDTTVWSAVDPESTGGLMAFLNTEKYPPSLLFLLMTLGPAILSMPLLERLARTAPRLVRPIAVYGNVAMLYYILHIPLIHLSGGVLSLVLYGRWIDWAFSFDFPEGYTPRLWVVYAAWVGVVLALYPVCAWYARLKRKHKRWWMSYL